MDIWNEVETREINQAQAEALEMHLPGQMAHVLAGSPFYRAKLGNPGPPSPGQSLVYLRDLPYTDKAELMADQAAHPPYGGNLCLPPESLRRVHKTSGTTGRPLLLVFSQADLEHTREAGARCFWAAGLRPGLTVAHCLNFCMWAGGLTDHLSLEATGATVVPFGVGNSKLLVETILLLQAQAIHCTPSYLATLEQVLARDFSLAPRDLGLRLGLFGAEGGLEDPNFRRELEEKWGLKAMNANYGMSEALSMVASECHLQRGLHFMGQGLVHAEIMDPASQRPLDLAEGATGELVLTNLRKQAQPLLRYRTHDMIQVLGVDDCPCGRRGFRFKVLGRSDDMLVIRGVNVFPQAVREVLNRHLDWLSAEHVILVSRQSPLGRMIVRVEARPDQDCAPARLEELKEQLRMALFFSPELEVVAPGTLPRAEGKSKRLLKVL